MKYFLISLTLLLFAHCNRECYDCQREGTGCPDGPVPLDNQIIVEFKDSINAVPVAPKLIQDKITSLINAFGKENVLQCGCDKPLILIKTDSTHFKPEERQEIAEGEVEQEWKNFGISVPKSVLASNYNPTRKEKENITKDDEVVIAIIDTGLNQNDSEIAGKMWQNQDEWNKATTGATIVNSSGSSPNDNCFDGDIYGYDFAAAFQNASRTEFSMHGTNVSKTIINSIDAGVKIKLMDLRVFDELGNGDLFSILCALRYAQEAEADIINMSFGFYGNDATADSYKFMKRYLSNLPQVLVASAGNNSLNTNICKHYPSGFIQDSSFSNLLSVAAQDDFSCDRLSCYSNYGNETTSLAAIGNHGANGEGTSQAAGVVTARAADIIYHASSYLGIPPVLSKLRSTKVAGCICSTVDPSLSKVKCNGVLGSVPDSCQSP